MKHQALFLQKIKVKTRFSIYHASFEEFKAESVSKK